MAVPGIDVVVVNFNGVEDTLACLETLRCQQGVELSLWVVDNGSRDESVDRLSKEIRGAHLLVTGRNLGFAGGFNVGLRACLENGANRILIINNDTLADPKMLSEMVPLLTPDVAVVAPIIYYADSPQKIWSQGGRMNWLLMEVVDNHGRGEPVPTIPVQRDFISGCCMLFSREALERVGLLDEIFFLYYEDLDWNVRLKKAGLLGLVAPKAKLWHKVSRSSGGANSPNERYWHARSSILYFRKHVHGLAWAAVLPWRFASALRISAQLILAGEMNSLRAYWKGIRDGIQFRRSDDQRSQN